ncbi:alkaline phosphatase family protein [Tengunoibacter tsumagoiensis]|uniref:Acid phosphatase n=1 Tax=Tengunoibacter tsumagoiensis TaxID=2014871 RepID=A0A401ZZG7_9CHLR|nr:alkaline phosphatase family protein [Tengunoibacter tsumagoiensis]GCE12260.1 acid phosphatase [Tengunoibacter tsumagoiensis]
MKRNVATRLFFFLSIVFIGSSIPLHYPTAQAAHLPRPQHVVIVVEENHSFQQIIGSSSAPYINALAKQGALFSHSSAITHPSEPNYLALFSGSTHHLTSDACPRSYYGLNLGSSLLDAHDSFTGYSESMPGIGFTGCLHPNSDHPLYARKHNPWVNFQNLSSTSNQTFMEFPTNYTNYTNYTQLPTVAFVIPNQQNDMHSGSIKQGDSWLQANLDGYVQWAHKQNSLLIVTWDEDDGSAQNQIPTFFVGPMVKAGVYDEPINHYTVLRTLEEMYNLPPINKSAETSPITDIWKR